MPGKEEKQLRLLPVPLLIGGRCPVCGGKVSYSEGTISVYVQEWGIRLVECPHCNISLGDRV